MDQRRTLRTCAVISAFFLLAGDLASGKTNETHATAVLFENFETAFHTVSVLLSDSLTGTGREFVSEPFDYLRVGLQGIDDQVPAKLFADSDSVLVGTKDYHFPIGLGPVRSTRCYIAVLRHETTFDLSRYFKRSPVASVANSPVWIWSAELGEFGEDDRRPSSLFATQLSRSYVVVSNDLEQLLKVSAQLGVPSDDASVLGGLREWNDVNQHDFWGYRKFKHDQLQIKGRISTGAQIAPDAEALITYVDLKRNTGILRLLCSNVDGATAKIINESIPPLKPAGPKAWQTEFPLTEVGPFRESAFWVQWLFGFGTVV